MDRKLDAGLILALAVAMPAGATSMHDTLLAAVGQDFNVIGAHDTLHGKLSKVESDYVCVQMTSANSASAVDRCYPFASIRWFTTNGAGTKYAIGVPET